MNYNNYSVLMSVYYKEKPEYLDQSINSIYNQTFKTNDFVLICDGNLNNELDLVIEKYQALFGKSMRVIRFEENNGLGHALNVGVVNCKNDLIARMDSDDVCKLDRFEKQIKEFKERKDISIIGSNVDEFTKDINQIDSIRAVPEKNEDIIQFMKTRNPFNHPSVMFKKSDVIESGNYRDVRYMQDYFLWVDMISNGKKGYNIQESLVMMRANSNMFKRRSGKEYFKIQKKLFKLMLEKNIINRYEYHKSISIRTLSCYSPNWLRKIAFKSILRKKVIKNEN